MLYKHSLDEPTTHTATHSNVAGLRPSKSCNLSTPVQVSALCYVHRPNLRRHKPKRKHQFHSINASSAFMKLCQLLFGGKIQTILGGDLLPGKYFSTDRGLKIPQISTWLNLSIWQNDIFSSQWNPNPSTCIWFPIFRTNIVQEITLVSKKDVKDIQMYIRN